MKTTFVMYKTMVDAIECIDNAELKAKAYKMICDYALNGIAPSENADTILKIIFTQAKSVLDSNAQKYDTCVENGKRGGAPKGNQNAKKTTENNPNQPKTTLNDNVYVNDNVNVNLKERDKREKEQQFFDSLSKYKNFSIDVKTIDFNLYNISEILRVIQESKFLQSSSLTFVLEHYLQAINNKYKDFNVEKIPIKQNYTNRDYSNINLNAMFDDITKIQL